MSLESPQPVLQIIHVTDLHVKQITANLAQKLYAKRRRIGARLIQYLIESHNLFGWQEGTQGYYPHAPEAFRLFLKDWKNKDQRWFSEPGDKDSAQTWLLDTGDLTAFGDEDSIKKGKECLETWLKELGGIRYRTLFGNHDAWPEAHPMAAILGGFQEDVKSQRSKIYAKPEWQPRSWLKKPLSVAIPYTDSRIELYGLDTVAWSPYVNTIAAGKFPDDRFTDFREILREQWSKDKNRHFRILAIHHPMFFPYQPIEKPIGLLKAKKWAREMRNDENDPPEGFGPLVHLFLSGHTHAAYPAGKLPNSVTSIHQGLLHDYQLQLVGGPLMLNKSEKAKPVSTRSVDRSNCQAQILRFYSDKDQRGQLKMTRIPIWSQDGSKYLYFKDTETDVWMYYDTP